MKILLLNSIKFTYTFIIANLLFANVLLGQTVGDYRSNNISPAVSPYNWTSLSSWQVCTSVYPSIAWGAATNYPGQIAGNYAVLIQTGDVINIGTSGITTQAMGTITINGSFILTGINTGSDGTVFFFNTQTIIVTPLSGTIKFVDKVNLKLPTNATLQVKFDLAPNPDYYGLIGDCNHNQDIIIGSSTYAYCNGGGSTGLTFYEVMGGGGTLNAVPGSNSPICYGDTLMLYGSYYGPTGSGITYTWTVIDPNGITSTVVAKDTSIVNAISGNYVVKLTCNTVYGSVAYSNSETILVTVNPLLSPPTVGTIIQPTCALPSGSVVLSDLPASGTWTLTRSPGGVTISGTGTSTTISEHVSGTYTYTVSKGNCISGASSDVVINATTNTWNVNAVSGVGSWTNTLTNAQDITFNGNYNSAGNSLGDLTACSCIVNAGVSVNINSGDTLTLTNGLTVNTLGFGDITFFDGASLVQINDVENSGEIDYQRITPSVIKTDYIYWSSPVTPMTLGDLYYPYTSNGTFYSYEATAAGEDWSPFDAGSEMVVGKGYIANQGAEIPSVAPPSDILDVTFTGVPNNGNITIPVLYTGIDILGTSNLIGNPYPSALDADKFLAFNSSVLDGTLYFWTHNTALDLAASITNPGPGWAYTYSLNDYAAYNSVGGVGVGSGTSAISGGSAPTGKIASGQGFFATGIAAGTITFNNDMRVGVNGITGDNSQFFRTKNPTAKTAKKIEKNRIWLNLTNTQGAFKQTLVGYVTDATNDYDSRFDGESFDGNEFVDFYSLNQDRNLVIQGRALPFDATDEVPLGFRTTIDGAFTINIDQVDGFLTNQAVFIEDKLTNAVFDLKSGNYTFNTVAGTFNDRFVLRYNEINGAKTLETANFDSLEKTVLVSNKNKQIKIDSTVESMDKVAIYDLLGRQIYQKVNVNSNELSIANLTSSHQTLVVKTTLQNGKVVANKIIF